jgi:hydrogenase expression/formation protein HypE
VPRGAADKLFINTTGIAIVPDGINVSGSTAREGDRVLLSGTIGDHGIAIASARDGIAFKTTVESDSAPLNWMITELVSSLGQDIHVLRDPTRGGLATVLSEIAGQSNVGVSINETAIPVKEAVKGACELLGYDPLYLANEGKLVAVMASDAADRALEIMKRSQYGKDACFIGEVTGENKGKVILKTAMGGSRLVDKLSGEMLPRIC